MSNIIKSCAVLLLLAAFVTPSADAIERVSRKLNFFELNVSYLNPVGEVNDVLSVAEDIFDIYSPGGIDADDVYDQTFALGVAFGQIRGGHLGWSAGFRYTKHEVLDPIPLSPDFELDLQPEAPSLNQYDAELNINYYLTDINTTPFAPYVGVGVAAGILSASYEGFDSENELEALGSLNFGFDLRLWKSADGRDLISLASVNRYDLVSTAERPKYLTIGGAVRLYIRP